MSKTYTTKTASLKATTADIRKIDAEEIKVWTGNANNISERVNILDFIKNGNAIYDDRGGNITENDIWPNPITLENTHITTDTKGKISINYRTDTYNTFDCSQMTSTQRAKTKTAAKVIDNKVYGADGQLLMNWETAAFTNENNSSGSMSGIFGGTDSQKAPITEWDSDLSSLENGGFMFTYTALESFNGDLSSLTNGSYMFNDSALESFNEDLSSLTNGSFMFNRTALQSFKGDMPKLTDGGWMFSYSALQSFDGDLSSLTNGYAMFHSSSLQSFNGDLSSLTNAYGMFTATSLESFNGDLSSLTSGYGMFNSPLQSFNSNLSSLTNGSWMFPYCKLDAESVHNILHTINPDEKTGTDEGTITIGTNIINDSTLEAQKLEFAKTCLCDSWDELNDEFTDKHWSVTWQFNGVATSTASTLELGDSNVSTALWAKLEEVTDENEPYCYISEEDGKHYNIHWFHETNGSTEDYQYFGSLLEACGSFGVIPKEYA